MDDTRQAKGSHVADEPVDRPASHTRRPAHFAARHFDPSLVEQFDAEPAAAAPEPAAAVPSEPAAHAAHAAHAADLPVHEEVAVPAHAAHAAHAAEPEAPAAQPSAEPSADPQATVLMEAPEAPVPADSQATVLMEAPEDVAVPDDPDATVLMDPDPAEIDAQATVLMDPAEAASDPSDPADPVAQDASGFDPAQSWKGMYVTEEDYSSATTVPFAVESSETQAVDPDATAPFFMAINPDFEMDPLRSDAEQARGAARDNRKRRDPWAWVKPAVRSLGLAAGVALLVWGGVSLGHAWRYGTDSKPDAAVESAQRENKPLTALSAQDMALQVGNSGSNAARPTTTREPAMGEIYGEPIVISRGNTYYEPEPEEEPASPQSAESPESPKTGPVTSPETTPAPAPETAPAPEPTPSEPTPAPETTPSSAPEPPAAPAAPATETQALT